MRACARRRPATSATPRRRRRPRPRSLGRQDETTLPGRGSTMTITDTAPSAVHIGADELPFVEIGNGNKLKVLQVREREGLWIVQNVFQAGFEVQTHRHTGPVWGYTVSGAWK